MIEIKSSKIIYCDIDDTLVDWSGTSYKPNKPNIDIVKRFHARGHTLIAWSAGGGSWAARIIKELKLEKYFTAAMSKPDWFIDDKPSSHFMPEHNRVFAVDNLFEIVEE